MIYKRKKNHTVGTGNASYITLIATTYAGGYKAAPSAKRKKWTFWDSWKLRRKVRKMAKEAAAKALDEVYAVMKGK
jgi:hypothetical protein